MSIYCGKIGFVFSDEVRPGVFQNKVIEKQCFGNILSLSKKTGSDSKIVDDIIIDSRISILGEPYIHENLPHIKYLTYMGNKWKVSSVIPADYPRLTITLGGVYNENN